MRTRFEKTIEPPGPPRAGAATKDSYSKSRKYRDVGNTAVPEILRCLTYCDVGDTRRRKYRGGRDTAMMELLSYSAAMSEIPAYRKYCRASGCAVCRGVRWEGCGVVRRVLWSALRAQGSPTMAHCVLRGLRRAGRRRHLTAARFPSRSGRMFPHFSPRYRG